MNNPDELDPFTTQSSQLRNEIPPQAKSVITTFSLTLKSVFHGLDDETIETLKEVGQIEKYGAGHVLIKQGNVGETFFILLEGRVAVTKDHQGGEEFMLGILNPGKYFGEMSLLDDVVRTATCTTMTPVSVLEITKSAFNQMVKESPQLAYLIMFQILSNLRRDESNALIAIVEKAKELEASNYKLRATQARLIQQERAKRELEIAGEVQRDLLPRDIPDFDRYEISSYIGAIRAGADFFDVIELDDEHIGILLGDVGDRGIQASIHMTMIRTLFRVESGRAHSPLEVARAAQDGMLALGPVHKLSVKAMYGVLHRSSGLFTYVNAGQERPYLSRPGQGIAQLKGKGESLGNGSATPFELEEKKIGLKPNDRLLFFSSGLLAVTNEKDEPFNREELLNIIKEEESGTASGLTEAIVDKAEKWHGNRENEADIALLTIRVKG